MQIINFICQLFSSARIVENYEEVTLVGPKGTIKTRAKIDTGANMTSVDYLIAKKIGLIQKNNIVGTKTFISGLGKQSRKIAKCTIIVGGKTQQTSVSISDRGHMRHKVIVGRINLQGMLVRPGAKEEV